MTELCVCVFQSGSGRRRGNWVRVRVKRPRDGLATAESQNAGSFPGNVLVVPSPTSFTKGAEDVEGASLEKGMAVEDLPAPTTTGVSFADEPVTAPEDESLATTTRISSLSISAGGSGPEEEAAVEAERTNVELEAAAEPEKQPEPVPSTSEPVVSTLTPDSDDLSSRVATTTSTPEPLEDATTTVTTTTTTTPGASKVQQQQEQLSKFLGSTTSTKVSMETEICFRGRCIKTKGSKDTKQQQDAAKEQLDQVPVE